jgi:hypothetical protein
LDVDGTVNRFKDTDEFGEKAIAHCLEYPAPMLDDLGLY